MNIFFEIHQDLPREAPGDNASTRQAFSLLTNVPPQPKILDIGCGPGMQTIELAKLTNGQITAVDTYQPYLDELQRRALAEGVSDNINTLNQSMLSLDFAPHSFDILWSEGAIYIMGFEAGLKSWQTLLKKAGYLVVSELCWLQPNPPTEVKEFWQVNYPDMKRIDDNLQLIEASGYRQLGHFVIPKSSWWDNYYTPLKERLNNLRHKYSDDPQANQVLDNELQEIEIYQKYSDRYGYVFYIIQVQ